MNEIVRRVNSCRACKQQTLHPIFTLGPTPLANAFLKREQIDQSESFYPLDVVFCTNCNLTQLAHVVSPELLFRDYIYVSSTSPLFIKHFEDFAAFVVKKFKLDKGSFVVDIGSNDGILLNPFKVLGMKILGIDPAVEIAQRASMNGIETIPEFFSSRLAHVIRNKHGAANVITASNVFAHIDDLDEIIKAVKILLSDDGVFIIEAPYMVQFLKKNLFDTVYHEHLSYLSVKPLSVLFGRFGMEIFRVETIDPHGGSIRVYVQRSDRPYKREKSVQQFINLEKRIKLGNIKTYQLFARQIYKNKSRLVSLLTNLKMRSKTIAAYGAPAKGNTLLNFFGIGRELIDFVIDDSPWKQGLFTPGKRIPVVPSSHLYKNMPHYVLILAWNFSPSIMKNHEAYKKSGGKFIIPIPQPRVL